MLRCEAFSLFASSRKNEEDIVVVGVVKKKVRTKKRNKSQM